MKTGYKQIYNTTLKPKLFLLLLLIFSIDYAFSQTASMSVQIDKTEVRLGGSIKVDVKFSFIYPNSVNNPTHSPDITISLYKANETFENGGWPITSWTFNITNSDNWNGVWYSKNITIPNNIDQGIFLYHLRVHKEEWPQNTSTQSKYTQSFTVSAQQPTSNNPSVFLNSETKNSLTVSTNNSYFTNQLGYEFSAFSSDGSSFIRDIRVGYSATSNPVATINNLEPETEYCIKVRAYNAFFEYSPYSSCYNFTTSPYLETSPSDLQATATSGNAIDLSWTDNNTDETHFVLERSLLPSSDFGQIAIVNYDIITYKDQNLEQNTTYYYRIKACNNDGSSAYSNVANATTFYTPVIYSMIDFYNEQNVTPNPNNPNNYINKDVPIRFKISVHNELTQNLASLSGTITCSTPNVTITDNTVSFNNIASDATGWSSDEFEITTDNTIASGTKLEFELSVNDQIATGGPWVSNFSFPIAAFENGVIVLDDDNNPDSNGDNDDIPEPGETIEILPTLNNVSDYTIASVSGTLTSEQSFIDIWNGINGASGYVYNTWKYNLISNVQTAIEPGAVNVLPEFDYVFDYPSNTPLQEINFNMVVEGKLNDNNGTLMRWSNSFLYNEGIEPPPVIVSIIPNDDDTDVAVDIDFVITFDKNITAVSSKYIYVYESNGSIVSTIEATNNQVSIANKVVTINLNDDLNENKNYYIIIDAGAFIDASGSDFAGIDSPDIWNFTTLQNNPPDAPVNVSAVAISSSEIEVSWDAATLADTYKILSCNENITYTTSTTATSFLISNLDESTTYDFIVKSENSAGVSDASDCVSTTTFCMHPWTMVTYANSTTAYGIVTIEGEPATENDIVGVFVDEECRGLGKVSINEGIAYVTINIQGETVETLNFKIWDTSECTELNTSLEIESNPGGNLGYPPDYLQIASITCDNSNSPIANFSSTTDNLKATFANSSQNADSYLWNFGDNNTSTEENPVHTYSTSGTYTVRLTGYNNICGDNVSTQNIAITATGIENLSDKYGIKIYPNPSTGKFTIEADNLQGKNLTVEIVSANGTIIQSKKLNNQSKIDFDLQVLCGVYFMRIKTKERIILERIVINK